jgi:glycine/sarcosine/betaine reductase complex component C subunit beta
VSKARISHAAQILAHTPDLVFSGSKPRRELAAKDDLFARVAGALRSYEAAARYLPNQVFIGAREPKPLTEPDRPWWDSPTPPASGEGPHGLLFTQEEFLTVLSAVDSTGLVMIDDDRMAVRAGPHGDVIDSIRSQRATGELVEPRAITARDGSLGSVGWGYPGDESLAPEVVLENLATKATAVLALAFLLHDAEVEPDSIDLVLSCSEEAIGDRYQRGGGNLGKAVAEAVGATASSGFDIKNFCAAPIPALVVAASLVESGVARRVAVVAGGSLPKVGMKFQGHLSSGMPVLEDCLGGVAILIGADDGLSVRFDAVGLHRVADGNSPPQVFSQLVLEPLERVGLKASDVGLFGTELHNPELTEPQGSGDVPTRNYRTIGALAAQRHHITRDELDEFLRTRCVAGFAPTQGHIASAICLLPRAMELMARGEISRAQLIAKGSLFLGRMTRTSDGMSMILES